MQVEFSVPIGDSDVVRSGIYEFIHWVTEDHDNDAVSVTIAPAQDAHIYSLAFERAETGTAFIGVLPLICAGSYRPLQRSRPAPIIRVMMDEAPTV